MFNPKRLSLARKRRGLTGTGLAEQAKVSRITVVRSENGESIPDDETILRYASALMYPTDFFFADDPDEIETAAVSFRSLTKMSARERDASIAAGMLGLELNAWIEREFDLPRSTLIDLSYETDMESAASAMRQHWALGEKPIGNVLGLLEANGVRVGSLA